MGILFSELIKQIDNKDANLYEDREITMLSIDSRKPTTNVGVLFFALTSTRRDGHDFIPELFANGVSQFVVSDKRKIPQDIRERSNWVEVVNVVTALQQLANFHRNKFKLPVIGITGSNGKTIVKDWLSQLLAEHHQVISSPKSFNSQLGVPLSVWQLAEGHELAVFEAGISLPGEMEKLERVIQPTIGILTNIGSAHEAGFESALVKAQEKLKLFVHCEKLIYRDQQEVVREAVDAFGKENSHVRCVSWSIDGKGSSYNFKSTLSGFKLGDSEFPCQFSDAASRENFVHCIVTTLEMGFNAKELKSLLPRLESLTMRLELKRGIAGGYVVDDSYSNDLASLRIALDFMVQQGGSRKKTLVLSDVPQAAMTGRQLYEEVAELLTSIEIDELIAVGPEIRQNRACFNQSKSSFYKDTEHLMNNLSEHQFDGRIVLVKGARAFQLERVVSRLQEKTHGTRLDIDLNAIADNLNFYRNIIQKETKLMVMVKALAYGGGSYEIASTLAYHGVDYLAVAYPDEGIELRQLGITTPILVLNVDPTAFHRLIAHDLEPEIYAIKQLKTLLSEYSTEALPPIHLKLDTGMHRLGFEAQHLEELIDLLMEYPEVQVASIFTHLASSEDPNDDQFTFDQIRRYLTMYQKITDGINQRPIKHVLNSAGITRFPDYQFDMVRLGIGLYGVESNPEIQEHLRPVSTLITTISQIRDIKAGESVGYNRAFVADKPTKVATIALGYADGYDRRFGNGAGRVLINGKEAPVIGNVCMDMTMIDLTGIEAEEGDEVIVFGEALTVSKLAKAIGTIPYELLTNIGGRVKRVFHQS